ncbi:MAG: hypothetical protein ABH834_08145 [Candidatus Altiarchaeota archaeon]
MVKVKKQRACVVIDMSERSPGPGSVLLPELGEDLRRLAKTRPEKAAEIAGEWRSFRDYATAVGRGEDVSGAPVKMNAKLVHELLDVLPAEDRVDYSRRRAEIDDMSVRIGKAREGYHVSGDPVIYTHSKNVLERGTKKVFHPAVAPSSSDVYVRIGDDHDKIVSAVKKRVVDGGEVTLSGGWFKSCVAQAAVLLAAEGFDVVVPEELTDAKIVRDSGDGTRIGEMYETFMNTVYGTASTIQEIIEPQQICITEEKRGDYSVWRFRKETSAEDDK